MCVCEGRGGVCEGCSVCEECGMCEGRGCVISGDTH